jgi:quercetin dioxygenase-like cupin family protein
MTTDGKNYTAQHIGPLETLLERDFMGFHGKYFIGAQLGLTGCEVSLNRLPAGKGMPFVHAHTKNEELYIVLRGSGTFYVDGEEFPIQEGSLIRVAPEGGRAWKAGEEDLYFICIQAEAGSLSQATLEDGFHLETRASWMKKSGEKP